MNSSSTDPVISSISTSTDPVALLTSLKAVPEKAQLSQIVGLEQLGETGWSVLMEFLFEQREGLMVGSLPNLAAGKVYQILYRAESPACANFLQTHFPHGIVPLRSQTNIDYSPLQKLLAQQDFQAADKLTLEKMCELAGAAAMQRNWIYFTEVEQFPAIDLQTLNALWLVHSEGKFGFSVQREIWLSAGKNWIKLWSKIGWKNGNTWTRYPQEFTWDLTAPKGHLPLSNQLRGVRMISALLAHPAWTQP
ncbi:GUN4 N-terminal ARM-like repeat domain-containing protein [Leptolyngbyaceae cyanobacterium UHCC 1019]